MANALSSETQRIYANRPAQKIAADPKLRLHILDSIRGWAAIDVLIFHVCHEVFANKLPEFGRYWISLCDGGFAVAIFFVLSGEALSHAYFVRNDVEPVRKLAIKRYVRLTIPIFASCLIVFLLMKANLVYSHEAAVVVDRPDWLGRFLPFEPSVGHLLSYSLIGVYFQHTTETSYNPVLWSMSVELFGSVLVFLTLFVTRNRTQRWVIFALLTPFMVLFAPFFVCFIFGMVFGELRVAGTFKRLAARPAANVLSVVALIGVAAGLTIVPFVGLAHFAVAQRLSIGAAVFLFAIYSSNWLQSLFDNRLSHVLGELSFPIYLVHVPIIVSLESFLILRLFPDGIVTRAPAYFIMLVSLAASLLAARAFVHVERFAIRASNAFFTFIDRL
ncbi:acyltransferase [Methylocapsa polymorpha]|uniref:Acyltransferase n=1 Tax=Methylocapsa polymorpha TaxID=3080828 RepID=A0ABZ0HS85_9HYPH|nr:acyltransferase [Methylocapsa sp. RX1]